MPEWHPYRMVIHCAVCDQDLASASALEKHYQAMLGSLVMVARHHREQVGENHWINWRYLGEEVNDGRPGATIRTPWFPDRSRSADGSRRREKRQCRPPA